MPSLTDILSCCDKIGSPDDCESCLQGLINAGIIDPNRRFQLWEEQRLPKEVWTSWHAEFHSKTPTTIKQFIHMLGKHISAAEADGKMSKFLVTCRPSLVARTQVRRAGDREPLRSPASSSPTNTSPTRILKDDSDLARFEAMIRRNGVRWIGWWPSKTDAEFSQTMTRITTIEAAIERFALKLEIEPTLNGEVVADLFVFELPPNSEPRIPTLGDAISFNPLAAECDWHTFFMPAPLSSAHGIIRDLVTYDSAEAQKKAEHKGCLAEAVMPGLPGFSAAKCPVTIPLTGPIFAP